jgi:uncharacterized protein YkwD
MNTPLAFASLSLPTRSRRTALAWLLAALVAGAPALAQDAPAPAHQWSQDRTGAQSGRYELHLAALINAYRADRGLPPLELTAELNVLASEHSSRMSGYRRLSHDSFRDRFDRTRAGICVENVGVDFPHAEAQLDGWRASPGHHRNLLEPKVARMGIAKSESFVTFFACS